MKEDPSRFFELIWRYGCDKHEVPKFVYGLQMDNKVSYRFLQYVVDRYRSLKGGKYMEIADEISRLIQFEDGDIPFNERSVEDIIEDHLRKTVADCNCDPDPELEPVEVPEHPYAEWSDWEDEN